MACVLQAQRGLLFGSSTPLNLSVRWQLTLAAERQRAGRIILQSLLIFAMESTRALRWLLGRAHHRGAIKLPPPAKTRAAAATVPHGDHPHQEDGSACLQRRTADPSSGHDRDIETEARKDCVQIPVIPLFVRNRPQMLLSFRARSNCVASCTSRLE